MIKKKDIIYAVTKGLYSVFNPIPVFSLDTADTIEHEAFYVDLITNSRESEAKNYVTKKMTIDILYKLKERTLPANYMDIEDQILDNVFINYLYIKSTDSNTPDRKPHISGQRSTIVEGVLHCMFNITIIDQIAEEDNRELFKNLRKQTTYTDNVKNPILK